MVLCRSREDVEEAERRVRIVFERLKLTLHPEKTRKLDFTEGKEGFDFLGCRLHMRMSGKLWERKRIRRYHLQRWPSKRSMTRVKELTDSRRGGVKDVKVLIDDLNPGSEPGAATSAPGIQPRSFANSTSRSSGG